MPSAFQPKGRIGSWFATWQGRAYPCTHNHWRYAQSHDDPFARPGERRWDEFISAIRDGMVVIDTMDDVPPDPKVGGFRRTGYLGLWAIDNFALVPNDAEPGFFHLRFRFTKRLV